MFNWLKKIWRDQRGAVNPLVIEDAGVPGAADSYWSAEQSLATAGGGANTAVTAVGWLQIIAVAAISVKLRITTSPTFVTVLAANTPGMVWSDGTNIYVSKSSGGAGTAKFYILQHKP